VDGADERCLEDGKQRRRWSGIRGCKRLYRRVAKTYDQTDRPRGCPCLKQAGIGHCGIHPNFVEWPGRAWWKAMPLQQRIDALPEPLRAGFLGTGWHGGC